MVKFSRKQTRPNVKAPLGTTDVHMRTHEGLLGYGRDPRSELFLLAVSNMVREATFYEDAGERDRRFTMLIHEVTQGDPGWITSFVPYLRDVMQMRSAAVVMAAEYVYAGGPHGRAVVAAALQRADEPAEILAYWAEEHGRAFPQPLKRGVADAARRLYTERAALKYDGVSRAWRMGDVIDLVHPRPRGPEQSDLYRWLLDRRHKREVLPENLPMIRRMMELESVPIEERRNYLRNPEALAEGGITWERLSGWLQGPMDAQAWEAVIPSMGYMALMRNLRNFEQTGVSSDVLNEVAAKLADPEHVSRSRQFPIRFYSAFKNIETERFGWVLEQALEASLQNIPVLPGSSLVLVDASGSMNSPISHRTAVLRCEIAALFGGAIAKRCENVDLFAFSNSVHRVNPSGSVLRMIPTFMQWHGAGGGTQTLRSLAATYRKHDRIIIVTDEQAYPGSETILDQITCPIYTFNIAGYRPAQMLQGERGRYVFGGLSDAGFRMMHLLEQQQDVGWPWMQPEATTAVV